MMVDVKAGKQHHATAVTRRDFIGYSALAALSAAGLFSGCATDPVTGRTQLMLMSKEDEVAIDRRQSPFQFSSDYGISQDKELNRYIDQVGKRMLPTVHRQDMPYSFQCVNATYVNAYAFPGGSIAVTRGILIELENEGELAGLLGHELGHVNARHSAEQVSKGQVSAILIGGLSVLASTQGSGLGELTQQLGALGQGLYLSKYSRNNEREADALGHEYMTQAGYSSKGFVGLMEMLARMNRSKSNAVQMLFATHPMSQERLDMALARDLGVYQASHSLPLYKERYMDMTASLRKEKDAIKKMQEGERYLSLEKYDQAAESFTAAIQKADQDYTAHVLMGKCMLIQKKPEEAQAHAGTAKQIYPEESQGYYISGLANLALNQNPQAEDDFKRCDELLPGNPQVTFYRGYALDKSGAKTPAAQKYAAYLKAVNYASNKYSQYAYNRLKAWGHVR